MAEGQMQRKVYSDYLRVFATLAVIIIHVSSQNWATTNVNGFEWQFFNFADSVSRWAVPVFVMISGSLFLSRDIPVKKLYTKYILRMAISYLVWTCLYNLLSVPRYHMWYILMIIGIYMLAVY